MIYPPALVALDQFVNCLIPLPGDGWGTPDETLSARLFRCHLQDYIPAWPHQTVDAIFFWDEAHCHASWQAEWARAQLPNHYRSAIA